MQSEHGPKSPEVMPDFISLLLPRSNSGRCREGTYRSLVLKDTDVAESREQYRNEIWDAVLWFQESSVLEAVRSKQIAPNGEMYSLENQGSPKNPLSERGPQM
jgi:hypothetical protein